ncbi:M20/M25/M40 family metallo-hydrolase [Bacillus luteolus]|uniref:M20/M25/M40 family metallo-hydrolase n=2 Tax=Litchfieldia luteola TaxID=682179 RepID=A0ABR9QJ48_9BACI|nr:M20/M25/M40 family metallo-hydrolase [Cytobacillus luteolus]MBP1941372.1 acetylornithine deacetylase/succinyl-diaminopimelate desuccinylase-like protein [Cytobacillus luteolus]
MNVIDEALHHFVEIIKLDTTNKLQTEYKVAEYLKEVLRKEQIESEIVYSPNNRASFISRLTGTNSTSKPIVLLSHNDVVEAREEDWLFPPFSATIHDKKIWGRGTLDTKQLTIMHLMAFIHLKRLNKPLNCDVYFIATADEENGSKEGMEFIAREYPELFQNAIILSEGGGFTVHSEDEVFMLFASGEKGTAKVSVTASGVGGHAGSPPEVQAVMELTDALDSLMKMEIPSDNYPILQMLQQELKFLMNKGNEQGQLVKKLYDYMKAITFTPEKINVGGDQLNVIPYKAEAILEFRTLPNQTKEQFESFMKEWPIPSTVKCTLLSFEKGYESDPLDEIIIRFKEQSSNYGTKVKWVPFTALGRTDGRFVGDAASQIYGLSPTLTPFTEVLQRVHNKDEHIEVDSFNYGVNLMIAVLEDFCIRNGGGASVSGTKRETEPINRFFT